MFPLVLFFLIVTSLTSVEVMSARILVVCPFPAISHQNVFRAYNQELAKRGHELVIITPNPYLPKDRPSDNVTEIDISHAYKILQNLKRQGTFIPKRGVIIDMDGLTLDEPAKQMIGMAAEQFNHLEVKKLIENRDKEKFDLIVVEAFPNTQLIYADLFKAPMIIFSTLYGFPDHYESVGAASRHPILYPHLFRHKFRDLGFFEKVFEVYNEIKLLYRYWKTEDMENEVLRKVFGPKTKTIGELKDYVEMLFLSAHPIFGNNRPVPPSVVYLGAGLHLKPVKDIPKELKTYLDNSKRGVVYVSLGTNVPTSLMDKDLVDSFVDAFKALPYDILWKLDENNIPTERISKNVRIEKWFPQRDILTHPNIKVFVTQGGLQSTDEAIDAGVPLVGIPMLGDQWFNTNKYVELDIGLQLDSFTMNADDLLNAVKTVATDKRFKENIKRVKAVMYDQPQRPLERAVWWTEHVLRHGGGTHLRAPGANMSYREHFMLDFFAILVFLIMVPVLIVIYCLYYAVKVFKGNRRKLKSN